MKNMHEERNEVKIANCRHERGWYEATTLKVLWSDENRICLYHTNGRVHVRRLPGERSFGPCVQGTWAGGGGVECILFRPHS